MPTALKRSTYLFVLPWSLKLLGGVNQVVINLAREMAKSGTFEPLILITDWNSPDPIWEEVYGLRTVRWRVRPYRTDMGIKEKFAFILWERRFRSEFRRFCDEHQVAAINLHYPGPTAFTLDRYVNDFKPAIPLILSFHGTDVSNLRNTSGHALAQWRQLLRRATEVVVCSNDLGRRVVEIFGDEVTPFVIHNGLDTASFIATAGTAMSAENRIILNVAKFDENKGQDVLIQAFASIANDYRDLDLVFVGGSGKALPALKELCVRKGIDGRVHFFPDTPHANIAAFFQSATIFALPSRQEAFPIVLLEAGAFKLPVVASRIGGIPELLSDRITGRLVAPDNPVELALCLRSLLGTPEDAIEMGARLYQNVLANFTWNTAYVKYVALVQMS